MHSGPLFHQDIDTAPGFSMTPSEHWKGEISARSAEKSTSFFSRWISETGLTWGAKSGGSGKGGCTTVINLEGEGWLGWEINEGDEMCLVTVTVTLMKDFTTVYLLGIAHTQVIISRSACFAKSCQIPPWHVTVGHILYTSKVLTKTGSLVFADKQSATLFLFPRKSQWLLSPQFDVGLSLVLCYNMITRDMMLGYHCISWSYVR